MLAVSKVIPTLTALNERAQALGLVSGSGAPLCFVAPDGSPDGYEWRAFHRGEVVTRPDNWHDAYNAYVWFDFPLSKAALNRRHLLELATEQGGPRGRVRDRLTQFDECGIVITGMRAELWQALCAHCWREVFVAHRQEIVEQVSFHWFGHATREALHAPYFGLCGKALWLDGDFVDSAELDAALAHRLTAADFSAPLQPLPVLGIPGVTAANADPTYYDDERQFRPARRMATGSSPGNR